MAAGRGCTACCPTPCCAQDGLWASLRGDMGRLGLPFVGTAQQRVSKVRVHLSSEAGLWLLLLCVPVPGGFPSQGSSSRWVSCPLQIQHTEDMENEIDELLQEFEEKSGRTFLHTVCFY